MVTASRAAAVTAATPKTIPVLFDNSGWFAGRFDVVDQSSQRRHGALSVVHLLALVDERTQHTPVDFGTCRPQVAAEDCDDGPGAAQV